MLQADTVAPLPLLAATGSVSLPRPQQPHATSSDATAKKKRALTTAIPALASGLRAALRAPRSNSDVANADEDDATQSAAGLEGSTDAIDDYDVRVGPRVRNEQGRSRAVGPQRPALTAKEVRPNLTHVASGTRAESWLLDALNSAWQGSAVGGGP